MHLVGVSRLRAGGEVDNNVSSSSSSQEYSSRFSSIDTHIHSFSTVNLTITPKSDMEESSELF